MNRLLWLLCSVGVASAFFGNTGIVVPGSYMRQGQVYLPDEKPRLNAANFGLQTDFITFPSVTMCDYCKMYVSGGQEPATSGLIDGIVEHDFEKDKTRVFANLTIPRAAHVSACIDEKLYVCGGYGPNGKMLSSCEVCDMCKRHCEIVPEMEMPFEAAHQAIVVDKDYLQMFLMAGYKRDKNTGETIMGPSMHWNFLEPKWNVIPDIPTPRGGNAGAVMMTDGSIMVCGGFGPVHSLSCCEKYDPVNNKWSKLSDMATGRDRLGMVRWNGKIYAIGGYNYDTGALKCVEEYNEEKNTWGKPKIKNLAVQNDQAFTATTVEEFCAP